MQLCDLRTARQHFLGALKLSKQNESGAVHRTLATEEWLPLPLKQAADASVGKSSGETDGESFDDLGRTPEPAVGGSLPPR